MLVNSLLTLVKDSLPLVALLGYLVYAELAADPVRRRAVPGGRVRDAHTQPAPAPPLGARARQATDELAYVVEENVLAWRIVRLHGAGRRRRARFGDVSDALRRLSIKSVIAAARR